MVITIEKKIEKHIREWNILISGKEPDIVSQELISCCHYVHSRLSKRLEWLHRKKSKKLHDALRESIEIERKLNKDVDEIAKKFVKREI